MRPRGRLTVLRPAGYRRRQLGSAVLVLVVAALALWRHGTRRFSSPEALPEGLYAVSRVVDGDTLVLANRARVRLIGADTPEAARDDRPAEA